jgi:hypothetical protein
MSDESQPEICAYVLRCGKNRGNRCSRKVSKKDSQGLYCCGHCIKRVDPPIEPPVKEESKEELIPIADLTEVIDSISKKLDDEDEKERLQLLKEKEVIDSISEEDESLDDVPMVSIDEKGMDCTLEKIGETNAEKQIRWEKNFEIQFQTEEQEKKRMASWRKYKREYNRMWEIEYPQWKAKRVSRE